MLANFCLGVLFVCSFVLELLLDNQELCNQTWLTGSLLKFK